MTTNFEPLAANDAEPTDEIAIVGMAGRFPGAFDIDQFWRNLENGVESITRFTDEEVLQAGANPSVLKDPTYVKAGPIIDDIEMFDAAFFGLAPREAQIMDPQQRLFLEICWNALEHAGYDPAAYDGSIGVFAGTGLSTYMLNNLYPNRKLWDTVGYLSMTLGNDKDSLTTRVAYMLDLTGPSYAVQTYCSTSLVAVSVACENLLSGVCDMALAGGVHVSVPQKIGYGYQEGGIASPDGRCLAFDARAQGSPIGNGAGAVLLKRLDDALADGDTIHAVIKGSAVTNDGALRVGYAAPGVRGQVGVITEALSTADVDAESISYIETHGTGTALGDAVEFAALVKAFGSHTDKKQFCAVGSVKTNFGHLDRAAGVTGLIKTILSLKAQQLPATLHYEQPNPEIDFSNTPFFVNTELRDWVPSPGFPRRAGVSSFGIGGTNAHVIVQEAPAVEFDAPRHAEQVFVLSARTETALQMAADNLLGVLEAEPDLNLADAAYTLQIGRKSFQHRRIFISANRDEALANLKDNRQPTLVAENATQERPLTFMFAGVGDQYEQIARDLYESEPIFRTAIDRCSEILQPLLQADICQLLYPKRSQKPSGISLLNGLRDVNSAENSPLMHSENAQPIVFAVEYALAQQLIAWGLTPDALIGYSLGEYVAACVAGVLTLEDALSLVTRRAQLIATLPQGNMLAVPLSSEAVQRYLSEEIELAVVNTPSMCVLAGTPEAIEKLEAHLTTESIACRPVPTGHAVHSSLMQPIAEQFTDLLNQYTFHKPQIRYISNVTGDWISAEDAVDAAYWVRHLCQTVQFESGISKLLADDNRILLEIGAANTLASFVKQHPSCKRDRFPLVLTSVRHANVDRNDRAVLLEMLGQLWLTGYPVDWRILYGDERRQRIPMPTYPFERERYWIDALVAAPQTGAADSLGKRADVTDWFYRPVWETWPLLTQQRAVDETAWLVFADSHAVATQIASTLNQDAASVILVEAGEQFEQLSQQHFVIRRDQLADYRKVCAAAVALSPDDTTRILHLWNLDVSEQTDFMLAQTMGFESLLLLTQALASQPAAHSFELTVATANAQPVTSDLLHPAQATTFGICRVIPQEYQAIRCRTIDIALGDGLNSAEIAMQLLLEASATVDEVDIAYRQATRYVQRFVQHQINPAESDLTLRDKGVYLITGGLGNIGLTLADFIAQRTGGTIILTSRAGLPSRDTWAEPDNHDQHIAERIRAVQAIEANGANIVVVAANVADESAMQALRDTIIADHGGLNGIIHAAGVTTTESLKGIADTTESVCDLHYASKVSGLKLLHSLFADQQLDFYFLFSSLSAVLGGLEFGAYAAVNAFMDAYAHAYDREGGTRWISIDWDTWQFSPMQHAALGSGTTTIARFEMTPAEGLTAFELSLASDFPQLVNSTGDLNDRVRQWVKLEALAPPVRSGKQASARPAALASAYVSANDDFERRIATVWQDILGIDDIGIHDNFFDLGGNSLIGLQLVRQMQRALDVQIPAVALFEAPTVSTMTDYLRPSQPDRVDDELQQLVARRKQSKQQTKQDAIAIIGMNGRFPGANSVDELWQNLLDGVESISFFTDEELLEAGTDPKVLKTPGFVPARPILENVDHFDASFFGYSPRDAEMMDPQHRVFLECAWESLELAGYTPDQYKGLIGVYAGANISTYLMSWYHNADIQDSVDLYQMVIGADKDALPTAVSYKLNLRGPSFAVQTFCSTSLVATHIACQNLLQGECDIALAGGVSIRVPAKQGYVHQVGGMGSSDGHCRTFDAGADGTLFGDGAAIIMLKRLEDALADGDNIFGVIKGSAVNNDGSLKVGYTAPSVAGQKDVILSALENADVHPDTIGFVEAHGTATPLGDPIEVTSLTRAFREHTEQSQYCVLGSLKTNIGHLDRAAGVTGLIKAVLAAKHGVIPPNLHFDVPNPEIDLENSPFHVVTERHAWERSNGTPRRAGINSLGLGGTNVHIIVEEPPQAPASDAAQPWQLLLLSARTETALDTATANLAHHLRQNPDINLADVAYTLQVGRYSFEHRRMVVCRDLDDAIAVLESADPARLTTRYQADINRPVAFMFAGVGDHYPSIGHDLYEKQPIFREAIDACCDILQPLLNVDLREILYTPHSNGNGAKSEGLDLRSLLRGSSDSAISETIIAQPAAFVIEYAMAQLLQSNGVLPSAMVGYSLGEYVAACVAGVLSLEDALTIVATRAQLIDALPEGKMVAVSLSEDGVQPYLNEQVSLAVVNSPNNCILGGEPTALEAVVAQLDEQEITYRWLTATHAFHSSMMEPIVDELADLFASITLEAPQTPYLSNVTGDWITPEQATDPHYWTRHLCETVRFEDNIAQLLQKEDLFLLEIGPGNALASFVRQHPNCGPERIPLSATTIRHQHNRQSDQAFLSQNAWTLVVRWLSAELDHYSR